MGGEDPFRKKSATGIDLSKIATLDQVREPVGGGEAGGSGWKDAEGEIFVWIQGQMFVDTGRGLYGYGHRGERCLSKPPRLVEVSRGRYPLAAAERGWNHENLSHTMQ